MTAPPPRRPWWQRKRTWAAALLWSVAAYAVGFGPLVYAAGREWLPSPVVAPLFIPAQLAAGAAGEDAIGPYTRWWRVKALRDAGCTVEVLPDGTILTTRMPTASEREAMRRDARHAASD